MAQIIIPTLELTGDTDTGDLTGPPDVLVWPALIRWVLDGTQITATQLASRLGVNGRTMRRWIAGEYPPLPRERRLLLALAREVLLAGAEDER